jgi:16S rRNA (guanine527-N7)-methyltransferase
MHVQVLIENRRVETLDPLNADVLSARALAPLHQLLDFTQRHRSKHGMGLFPKGRTVHKEIERAETHWRFERRLHRSVTDPDAAIVEVGALSRA